MTTRSGLYYVSHVPLAHINATGFPTHISHLEWYYRYTINTRVYRMDDRTIVVAVESTGKLPEKSQLWQYFESKERSGGGTLDNLEIQDNGTALVVFRLDLDAENVESRDHAIDGVHLVVYPYYGTQLQSDASDYDNTATLRRPAKPKEPLNSEDIYMAPGKIRFFEIFPSIDIQTLTKEFEDCTFLDDKIVVKGNTENFKEKVHKFKVGLLDINEDTFDINKPLVYSCLTSKRGEEELRKIEKKHKCVIQIDQGYYTSRDKEEEPSVVKPETQITLVTGDIADQQVDVLVSTVSTDLDLTVGGVSSVLLRVGGKELQSQCRDKYPDGIKYKDIAKTDGGKLKCREIYHCCLPPYKNDMQMKTFGGLVYKCLFESTERGYKSIAFPALGAGTAGYPAQHVARMMFFKIVQFIAYKTSLTDIRIVVPPDNKTMMKAFEAEQHVFLSRQENNHDESDEKSTDLLGPEMKDEIRIGKLMIHIKEGEISQDDSRAVVNFVDTAVVLNAGCTGTDLLGACGSDVNLQCQLAFKTLEKNGVAITTAPNVPADFLLHIAVDHFKGSLKDMIKSCLKAASDHRLSSLAFPSLWADADGMSLKNIARLFIKCIEDHEKKGGPLTDVSIVIPDKTDCTLFLSLLQEIIFKKSRIKKGRFSYRKRDSPSGTQGKGGDLKLPPVEEVFVKPATDSDAEVTIYCENRETLSKAFGEVQAVYKSLCVKKTIINKELAHLSREKMAAIKGKLEEFNVYATVTWSTGVVEVEGAAGDVAELEGLLQQDT